MSDRSRFLVDAALPSDRFIRVSTRAQPGKGTERHAAEARRPRTRPSSQAGHRGARVAGRPDHERTRDTLGVYVMANIDEMGATSPTPRPRLRLRVGHRQPDAVPTARRSCASPRARPPGSASAPARDLGTRIAPVTSRRSPPSIASRPAACVSASAPAQHRHAYDGAAAVRVAAYADYLRVLGRTPAARGGRLHLRQGHPADQDRSCTRRVHQPQPRVPLYVSGSDHGHGTGGAHGYSLVFAIPSRRVPEIEALGHAAGAPAAGRALEGFRSCALANVALLDAGEPADSERVLRPSARTPWRVSTTSDRSTNGASIRPSYSPSRNASARFVEATPARARTSAPTIALRLHQGGAADRRRPGPRHLLVRTADRLIELIQRPRAPGPPGADVRHRRRRNRRFARSSRDA